MSEENAVPQAEPAQAPISTTVPMIIYVLYLISLVVGITSIVGVIMAYINKGDNNYLDSHYQFQIRTFWIGLLFTIIGVILIAALIGWFILLFVLVWYIVRCAKGIKYLNKQQEIPNPTSWMFG